MLKGIVWFLEVELYEVLIYRQCVTLDRSQLDPRFGRQTGGTELNVNGFML